MTADISVAVTGSAWAFLLYDNSKARNNQAGLLLGDVVIEKKNLISDSDYGEEKTETLIHIYSVVHDEPLSNQYTLMDSPYLKEKSFNDVKNTIVGWYTFRRNVTDVPTLKDRHMHKQLRKKFRGINNNFLMCNLTTSENPVNKTRSFKQKFLVYNSIRSKWEAVPLNIENLANVSPLYKGPLPPTPERLLDTIIDNTWASDMFIDMLHIKLGDELQEAVDRTLSQETEMEKARSALVQLKLECAELRRKIFEHRSKKRQEKGKEEEAAAAHRAPETGRRAPETDRPAPETDRRAIKRVKQAGEYGDSNNTKSVEVICISSDEDSPPSPVLRPAIARRLAPNFPKH